MSGTYETERTTALSRDSEDDVWVVYDGECPFCSRYVLLYQLRERGQRVHLIDARSSDPIIDEIRARNLDLNDGMVVRWRGQYHYGAEAMHLLAMLADHRSFFNRINRMLFSRPQIARAVYPVLVRARKFNLRLLGRKQIGEV